MEYPGMLCEVKHAVETQTPLDVERCGVWLYVSGRQTRHMAMLTALGFKWDGKKKVWAFHLGRYQKRHPFRTVSMGHIRRRYGSVRGRIV